MSIILGLIIAEILPSHKFVSFLSIILLHSFPNSINQASTHQISQTQPHGGTPNNSSNSPLLPYWLPPSPCQKQIHSRPCCANPRGFNLVVVNVQVGAEQQDRGKKERKELRGSSVLRCYEGCEKGRRERRTCQIYRI